MRIVAPDPSTETITVTDRYGNEVTIHADLVADIPLKRVFNVSKADGQDKIDNESFTEYEPAENFDWTDPDA